MKARRAYPEIFFKGVNISSYIENDLIEFSYTDIASGSADSISLSIQDRSKKWLSNWAPTKGDNIKAKIITENWLKENNKRFISCGEFIVDQPKYSGKPLIINLEAISMPNNSNFTTTKKSKTWQSATVREIAQTIANNSKLKLYFDSKLNPTIQFIEQTETSDKNFLFNLCEKYGLAMKLYSHKIIIFDEVSYESKPTVINIDETDLEKWTLNPSLTNTGYDGASISYFDAKTEKNNSYKYIVPGHLGNKILKLNDIVYSLAEAEIKVKGELRKVNKNETKLNLTIPGTTKLVASNTINITGLGKYSGKYYIDKINHRLNPYEISVNLHRVLEGY